MQVIQLIKIRSKFLKMNLKEKEEMIYTLLLNSKRNIKDRLMEWEAKLSVKAIYWKKEPFLIL